MKMNALAIFAVSLVAASAAMAKEMPDWAGAVSSDETESDRSARGKWRIGVGAAFNGKVHARLGSRNLPVPKVYAVPYGSSKEAAMKRANARTYDGGGFIAPDDLNNSFDTENWGFPVENYQGNGRFVLNNSYQEVIGSQLSTDHRDGSDDENQFGVSVEVSRELFVHDEKGEHRWGVDLALAASYFFQRDVYSARGTVTRTDEVRDGKIQTVATDPDAMYEYDKGWTSPSGGMYGEGNYNRTFVSPAFGWNGVGKPQDVGGPSHAVSSSVGYSAKGDYQELEMLLLLRPWYELTDWWRLYAMGGVGVSWGRFNTTFTSVGYSLDESFDQWDCYGVAGLGTAFSYGPFDLSLDFLGRFLRDDLDVNGRHVNGTISRADWGSRLMLGYGF